ncbi:SDR family oxidoreductase [Pseudonocardia nematodicida]|uniref:SDR family oxidoreductase n=1 Tax=Pseudonocardia nematodicida TaxID=1206997 RepID=A0ABV1K5B1_9PSEU
MGRLDDTVALVTGGASGMGLASATRFAEEGAAVVVADLDAAAADRAAAGIVAGGGEAKAVQVDVGSVASLRAMVEVVAAQYGRLNVLFNHAGIPGPPGLDLTEEEFDRTVDINLKSQFFGTQLALPLLRAAAPRASIIYTSSVSGLMAAPSSPIYGMTKGGTQILMRSVAKQLGPEGIRANAICPGPTNTPMLRTFVDPDRAGMAEGDDYDQQVAARAARIPLRRAAEPEDTAEVALFLASDESRYVTGTWIPVDGGMSA